MNKIVSSAALLGLLLTSAAAYAGPDAQSRMGWDNVDYFKQNGQLGATYPTVAVPADPSYSEPAAPSQRVGNSNYEYFDPKGAAAHGLTPDNSGS